MSREITAIQQAALNYRVHVDLAEPAFGMWDGGPESHFEFSPSIERSPGVPAVRWGSYAANLWVVIDADQESISAHMAAVRSKLRTSVPSRTTVVNLERNTETHYERAIR